MGIRENNQQDEIGRSRTQETHIGQKASEAFKQCIQEQQMRYKLVPPGNHQCNQAERMIQTFKAHFISILAGADNKFPLSLWCHLLKPTKLTLK